LAQNAAEMAVFLAEGKELKINNTINDGEYDVPFIKFDPILVNKDNIVEVIIEDGFHLLEEVYRNIPPEEWPKP